MLPRSLAFRLVASAAIWCALLLTVGGYALSAVFGNAVSGTFDARLEVMLEGLVAGSERREDGSLRLRLHLGEPRFQQPLSGWYWQINENGTPIHRSVSLWDHTLDVPIEAGEELLTLDLPGPLRQELRVLARPILLPGAEAPLLYVVAGDSAEVTAEKQRFNRTLSFALTVLFLGLLAAVLIQVQFGLKPLRQIGRALAAIRSGQSRRLEGAFPREIQPLATELNALLDHNENVVERAKTHVGNLAHGLKTPLAVLINEAERSRGPLGELVDRQVGLMRRQVEHHLARARAAGAGPVLGARCEVAPVLADLQRALLRIYAARALTIKVECGPHAAFRGARQDLEELLGNLLDNACKWARSQVLARGTIDGPRLLLRVEDDGPGLPPEQRLQVIERGRRLDQSMPGSGLGLSIVADIAHLYGGSLELDQARLGGLAAQLDLPAVTTEDLVRG